MYLKFGFGRTTSEVGNDIRRGAMTREPGPELGEEARRRVSRAVHPILSDLLRHRYRQQEFDAVLDKWANKDLFEKKAGRWVPTFEPY